MFYFVLIKFLVFSLLSSMMALVRTCGRDGMRVLKTEDVKNLSPERPKLIPCAKKRYI
jgi:hypothetical protein